MNLNPPWILVRQPEAAAGSGGEAPAGGTGTPTGGNGGSPSAGAGSPPSPTPTPASPVPGGTSGDPYAIVAGIRPEALPDKFWNPDTKAIRLPELMKGYNEANALIGRRVEQMTDPDFQKLVDVRVGTMSKDLEAKALQAVRGQAPAEAKDYKVMLSVEALQKLPEPMHELSQYEADPVVGWFRDFAHQTGLGQGQFQQAVEGYLGIIAQAQGQAVASERSKLGDTGQKRMEQLSTFLDANLEKRQATALRASMTSAEAFAAVESLVKKFADPSMIRGFSDAGDLGRTGPGLSTEQEIRTAQKDPRYWDPNRRDPGYVKAIENAWKNLTSRGNGAL